MLKLVLGIIAIGIAQLAFINYLGLDSPVELAAAPAHTIAPVPVSADLRPEIPAAEDEILNVAEENAVDPELYAAPRRISASRYTPSRRWAGSRAARSRHTVWNDQMPSASTPNFETIVIKYSAGAKRPSDCDSHEMTKPVNRSLNAGTTRAVIRPWQVVTTYDSRIN